jgi:hypothetical protein
MPAGRPEAASAAFLAASEPASVPTLSATPPRTLPASLPSSPPTNMPPVCPRGLNWPAATMASSIPGRAERVLDELDHPLLGHRAD